MYRFVDKGGNDVCMRPKGTDGGGVQMLSIDFTIMV